MKKIRVKTNITNDTVPTFKKKLTKEISAEVLMRMLGMDEIVKKVPPILTKIA